MSFVCWVLNLGFIVLREVNVTRPKKEELAFEKKKKRQLRCSSFKWFWWFLIKIGILLRYSALSLKVKHLLFQLLMWNLNFTWRTTLKARKELHLNIIVKRWSKHLSSFYGPNACIMYILTYKHLSCLYPHLHVSRVAI